ncbi:MAG: immunoglobulin domain-containing protein [Pirellulales bacterium]|nr:immunoglobulin domain-containing protein [Pirellulales bacterium]
MEYKTTHAIAHPSLRMAFAISTQEGTVLKVRENGLSQHDLFHIKLYSFVSTEVDNRVAPYLTTSPTSQKVDLNDRVTLSCSATGNPTPNIQWYKDGIAIKGPQAFGSEFVITETTPKQRGFYQCVAFSSFGPPARSDEVLILIKGRNLIIVN